MKKPRLLIVDDSKNLCEALSLFFKKNNYEVNYTTNTKDGYKKAIEIKPHIILSDYHMPEEDGLSFCRRIRVTPVIKNCIFLIMTNKDITDEIKDKFHDLPDSWISKFKGFGFILEEINKWVDCTFENFTY